MSHKGEKIRSLYRDVVVFCAALALALTAASISASHTFLWLAILFTLLWIGAHFFTSLRPLSPSVPHFRSWPGPLKAGAVLYGWVMVSTVVRLAGEPSWEFFMRVFKTEWRGVPMFALGLIIFFLADNAKDERRFRHAVYAFLAFLLLSGLASVFTEFRLAKIFTGHGTSYSALNRPQHPLAVIRGIGLYQPIGFMSTKLTYAGLLVISVPVLFGLVARRKSQEPGGTGTGLKVWAILGIVLGTALLLVNGTRSAMLGALVGWGLWLVWALWGAAKTYIASARMRGLAAGIAVLSVWLFAGGAVFHFGTDRIQNTVLRHTDFQRPIIWSGATDLVLSRPVFGAGAGFFKSDSLAWRQRYLRDHPDVWYFFEAAPAMHAHNDLLHFAAASGIPGAALFLWLILAASVRAWRSDAGGAYSPAFWFGAGALFVAGTAQCYFQDDRVTLIFWALTGLTCAWERESRRTLLPDPHP
ncbi:MAG: O-antigen ligase family protein [Spirochaetia bacterium]|nr:O-antigen ligase family protein [Spirochaetia bacterium]